MNKVCLYIHGIGYKNNSISICNNLKKISSDIEIIAIEWSDILDTHENEFIKKYSKI